MVERRIQLLSAQVRGSCQHLGCRATNHVQAMSVAAYTFRHRECTMQESSPWQAQRNRALRQRDGVVERLTGPRSDRQREGAADSALLLCLGWRIQDAQFPLVGNPFPPPPSPRSTALRSTSHDFEATRSVLQVAGGDPQTPSCSLSRAPFQACDDECPDRVKDLLFRSTGVVDMIVGFVVVVVVVFCSCSSRTVRSPTNSRYPMFSCPSFRNAPYPAPFFLHFLFETSPLW